MKLERFHCEILPNTSDLITWHIGKQGFDMILSGQHPQRTALANPQRFPAIGISQHVKRPIPGRLTMLPLSNLAPPNCHIHAFEAVSRQGMTLS
jgi:hypothetical protein